jgi:pyruvate/2-oxoglutarate dehydrogenase complex dihydrolipoamide dehydrogenase (E3) component
MILQFIIMEFKLKTIKVIFFLLLMDINKENVVLLGDGFFARGFLHYINYNKFKITQIYKDEFINPQDIMYSLERDQKYEKTFHFRDLINKFFKPKYTKIKEEIKSMEINNNTININNNNYKFDYLVIGLGANKSLADWNKEINNMYSLKYINVIGMGPIGLEIANILSNKNHSIKMFDLLEKDKVFNYVSPKNKDLLFDNLNKVDMNFGKKCNETFGYNLYCIGSRPNILTQNFIPPNEYLQIDKNIYVGGDCSYSEYIKTGQIAYQQGVYVAKRLNGEKNGPFDEPFDEPFKYSHNGMSLHLGNKKVLIEGHPYLPDNVYPDFVIKLYSMFFI